MFSVHPDLADMVDDLIETGLKPLFRSSFAADNLITLDKSAGFLSEPRFATAFEKCVRTEEERSRSWRLHTLTWAAEAALGLDGDFVECGVYEGFMSAVVANYTAFETTDKTFYLYDTFEGLNEKYSRPEDFAANPNLWNILQDQYQKPGIYEGVCERFAAYDNVKVIKGVVPDILLTESPRRIAYLHIDMNAAAAELGALQVLFDRVVAGGRIVFDDYGWLLFASQKAAADDFMRRRGLMVLELPTGQGLVIKS